MDFGLDIAQQRVSFDEVMRRAQFAERLGFTGVWGFDHFKPMYGEGPGECFEGMTTLAALSSATSTIRLGLLVTGVTYRHPSVFAAQALTVEHASHGRLDLAVGAAWAEEEHRQLGIDFPAAPERFDLLEDTLEILTRLYTGERVSYAGKRVSLDDAQMRPLPVQSPRPPLWIGGAGLSAHSPWSPGTRTCGIRGVRRITSSLATSWTGLLPLPGATARTSNGLACSPLVSPGARSGRRSSGRSTRVSATSCAVGPEREPSGLRNSPRRCGRIISRSRRET